MWMSDIQNCQKLILLTLKKLYLIIINFMCHNFQSLKICSAAPLFLLLAISKQQNISDFINFICKFLYCKYVLKIETLPELTKVFEIEVDFFFFLKLSLVCRNTFELNLSRNCYTIADAFQTTNPNDNF